MASTLQHCSSKFVLSMLLTLATVSASLAYAAPPRAGQSKSSRDTKSPVPIASGPGVVICEPVSAPGVSEETADFASGCSRWLQFVVGGQGQLGKTPLWASLNQARQELGRRDLRLKPADTPRLATILGITHAATGTVSGGKERCTLTFQLVQIAGQKPTGPPLTLTGSQEQIIQKLPTMATTLSKQLGISAPHLPAAVGAAPNDLALLGRLFSQQEILITPAQRQQLGELAKTFPIAGMITLIYVVPGENAARIQSDASATLLKQAPDNTLVFGQLGYYASQVLAVHSNALQDLLQTYPNNLNMNVANALRMRAAHDDAEVIKAAEKAIRINPGSTEAWAVLGDAYSDSADRIRRGKMWGEMTDKEQASILKLYPKWLQAYREAVRVDPSFGIGWREAAKAATFAGDPQFADKAIWKAVQLRPADPAVYSWGLEMFHPKWFGDETKRAKIADAAAAATYPTPFMTFNVAEELTDYGYRSQAKRLYERAEPMYREHLATDPSNLRGRHTHAVMLTRLNRLSEATKEYEELARLSPNDATAHYDLGMIYSMRNMPDESIKEFREALRLNPRSARTQLNIGLDLKSKGQFDQAEKEFRAALALDQNLAEAHFGLGDVYYSRKQLDNAIAEYRQAISLNPNLLQPYKHLTDALSDQKKFDSALKAAMMTVQVAPDDDEAHAELGYVYSELKDWPHAISECRIAIRLNPQSAIAHENLGDALIEQGHKAEAQAEWKRVLSLDHGVYAEEARKMLAKYP